MPKKTLKYWTGSAEASAKLITDTQTELKSWLMMFVPS